MECFRSFTGIFPPISQYDLNQLLTENYKSEEVEKNIVHTMCLWDLLQREHLYSYNKNKSDWIKVDRNKERYDWNGN